MKIQLTEDQMPEFGQKIAEACALGSVLFLNGTLGMGKTTLSRCIVQGMGWPDRVKSPTYNLVEQYDIGQQQVLHFDLYRLSDPEELEFMGIRDFDAQNALWLIEWPERGLGMLPAADILIEITEVNEARELHFIAQSVRGQHQVSELELITETYK